MRHPLYHMRSFFLQGLPEIAVASFQMSELTKRYVMAMRNSRPGLMHADLYAATALVSQTLLPSRFWHLCCRVLRHAPLVARHFDSVGCDAMFFFGKVTRVGVHP